MTSRPIIESVGFDVDDTHIASFKTRVHRTQEASRIMGLPIPSEESIAENYELFLERLVVEHLFKGVDFKEFKRAYQLTECPYSSVDGAKFALDFMLQNKVTMWVFSGSEKERLRKLYIQAGIDPEIFYAIITEDDTKPYKKSDSKAFDNVAHILKDLGIDYRKSLYIDDSLINYHAAVEAGFKVALLLGSPNSRGYETCVPAEDVLTSMYQLPEFIMRRLGPLKVSV